MYFLKQVEFVIASLRKESIIDDFLSQGFSKGGPQAKSSPAILSYVALCQPRKMEKPMGQWCSFDLKEI